MKIDKTLGDQYAILTLRGEFDTFYVPSLQDEVDSLIEKGICHLILNLRLVKFINSTALGAIIRFHKICRAQNGEVVIAHPSAVVRDIIGKVGLDQLVPVYDDEEQAIKHIIKALNDLELSGAAPLNQEKVLITFPDEVRNQQIGGRKSLVGAMCNVDGERLQFLWSGKKLGLSQDQAAQLFFPGSKANLKFQVKMFKKGFFELVGKVAEVESAPDDQVRVTTTYESINGVDREALMQFAADMEFLKRQLPEGGSA